MSLFFRTFGIMLAFVLTFMAYLAVSLTVILVGAQLVYLGTGSTALALVALVILTALVLTTVTLTIQEVESR